jgi:hypothetical protein
MTELRRNSDLKDRNPIKPLVIPPSPSINFCAAHSAHLRQGVLLPIEFIDDMWSGEVAQAMHVGAAVYSGVSV